MTIKELADRCGTHKTGIRRTIDRLGLSDQLTRDENGVIQVPDFVSAKVSEQYQTTKEQPTPDTMTPEQALQSLIDILRGQLEAQNAVIRAQQETIDTLTKALSNSQALQAGSLQVLNQITAPVAEPAPMTADQSEAGKNAPEAPEQNAPEAVTKEQDKPETVTMKQEGPEIIHQQEKPEPVTVPEKQEAPQPEDKRPTAPTASGTAPTGETMPSAPKAPQEAPQRPTASKKQARQNRKGFFGLFRR